MPTYETGTEAWEQHARKVMFTDECYICLQPYSDGHEPKMITGIRGCAHSFGSRCLKVWVEQAYNGQVTCPVCRRVGCNVNNGTTAEDSTEEEEVHEETNPSEEDSSDRGSDDDDYEEDESTISTPATFLDAASDHDAAADLVWALYDQLKACENTAAESEIKKCVEKALLEAETKASVPLPDQMWAKIRRTIKRMLRDSKTTVWDDHVEGIWIRRMRRVLR